MSSNLSAEAHSITLVRCVILGAVCDFGQMRKSVSIRLLECAPWTGAANARKKTYKHKLFIVLVLALSCYQDAC